MNKFPSKAVNFTVPVATVAVPVGSVVVLAVNETPVEQIQLLDSTNKKLKNIKEGMEVIQAGKPKVSEEELEPQAKPVVTPPRLLFHQQIIL